MQTGKGDMLKTSKRKTYFQIEDCRKHNKIPDYKEKYIIALEQIRELQKKLLIEKEKKKNEVINLKKGKIVKMFQLVQLRLFD